MHEQFLDSQLSKESAKGDESLKAKEPEKIEKQPSSFNAKEFESKFESENPSIQVPEEICEDIDNDWILNT